MLRFLMSSSGVIVRGPTATNRLVCPNGELVQKYIPEFVNNKIWVAKPERKINKKDI